MTRHRLLLLAALGSIALGCSKGTEPTPEITVNGSWSGTVSSGETISMVLSQTGTSVTGTGQLVGTGGSFALTVAGTYVKPAVALTLSATGFSSINFASSAVSQTAMPGTLNGSGYSNDALTLTRR